MASGTVVTSVDVDTEFDDECGVSPSCVIHDADSPFSFLTCPVGVTDEVLEKEARAEETCSVTEICEIFNISIEQAVNNAFKLGGRVTETGLEFKRDLTSSFKDIGPDPKGWTSADKLAENLGIPTEIILNLSQIFVTREFLGTTYIENQSYLKLRPKIAAVYLRNTVPDSERCTVAEVATMLGTTSDVVDACRSEIDLAKDRNTWLWKPAVQGYVAAKPDPNEWVKFEDARDELESFPSVLPNPEDSLTKRKYLGEEYVLKADVQARCAGLCSLSEVCALTDLSAERVMANAAVFGGQLQNGKLRFKLSIVSALTEEGLALQEGWKEQYGPEIKATAELLRALNGKPDFFSATSSSSGPEEEPEPDPPPPPPPPPPPKRRARREPPDVENSYTLSEAATLLSVREDILWKYASDFGGFRHKHLRRFPKDAIDEAVKTRPRRPEYVPASEAHRRLGRKLQNVRTDAELGPRTFLGTTWVLSAEVKRQLDSGRYGYKSHTDSVPGNYYDRVVVDTPEWFTTFYRPVEQLKEEFDGDRRRLARYLKDAKTEKHEGDEYVDVVTDARIRARMVTPDPATASGLKEILDIDDEELEYLIGREAIAIKRRNGKTRIFDVETAIEHAEDSKSPHYEKLCYAAERHGHVHRRADYISLALVNEIARVRHYKFPDFKTKRINGEVSVSLKDFFDALAEESKKQLDTLDTPLSCTNVDALSKVLGKPAPAVTQALCAHTGGQTDDSFYIPPAVVSHFVHAYEPDKAEEVDARLYLSRSYLHDDLVFGWLNEYAYEASEVLALAGTSAEPSNQVRYKWKRLMRDAESTFIAPLLATHQRVLGHISKLFSGMPPQFGQERDRLLSSFHLTTRILSELIVEQSDGEGFVTVADGNRPIDVL